MKRERRDGVYTVSNTYNETQTLLLDAHLDRLEDSARREGFYLELDRSRLRQNLRIMILASGYGDVRFRISVNSRQPDELLLSIEPFEPPAAEIISRGVRCITTANAARSNPASKSSDWMHRRESILADLPPDIYEAILVDGQGGMLEGLSSNFYAIKDDNLITAGEGVLGGISRQVVLEVCTGIISLQRRSPMTGDLPHFTEAFLTSSSRGIIPVVEIDGCAVGDGRVGSVTLALRAAYNRWVDSHLEEL